MLEALLAINCYFSNNTNACLKSAEAYYYYTGANRMVDDLSNKHRIIALSISTLGAIRENKISVPIYQKNFIVNLNAGLNMNELIFIKNF